MIFTTWRFGDNRAYKDARTHTGPLEFPPVIFETTSEQGRKAARQYAADIFNWCAARRDYPYADHPSPSVPWPLHWCAAVEIQQNCVREFNRSNETRTT